MVEGFNHRSVYQCLSTRFPLSCCGNPYPVAEKLPTVGVFFSLNPELLLMARSYCLFTESFPKIQSWLAPNVSSLP
jgi:hypothetical protein